MAFVINTAVKGIASGIGLGRETYKARKEKKQQGSIESPPAYSEEDGYFEENSEPDLDGKGPSDAQAWELDEAQDDLVGGSEPEVSQQQTVQDPGVLADSFIALNPAINMSYIERLPCPVMLPQRRPKDRTRGFVRAYPPILASRGIDSETFITFLETFNKSSLASPWLQTINLAGIATSFMTPPLSIVIGIIIQQVTKAAIEIHGRMRTNTFLDKVNAEFFQPRGLYAVVLTYKPDDNQIHQTIDLSAKIDKRTNEDRGTHKKLKNKFQASSGTTYGDMFSEVAPLIYPGLDALATQESQEAAGKRANLKAGKAVVSDYMDRRAKAKFAGKNPDSVLTAASGPKPEFKSRYADPNHPASNGSLLSLVTGGRVDLPLPIIGTSNGRGGLGRIGGGFGGRSGIGGGRAGLLGSRTGSSSRSGNEGDRGQRGGLIGGSSGGPRGGLGFGGPGVLLKPVKKVLTQDVMYLMIVDMPSEAEMAESMRVMAEAGM